MPASRKALLACLLSADPVLLEPILGIEAKGSGDLIGPISSVISSKRGKLLKVTQKGIMTIIDGEIPAAETFDLAEILRGATAGKVIWNTHFKSWKPVPTSLLKNVVSELRKRKGLSADPPRSEEFSDSE